MKHTLLLMVLSVILSSAKAQIYFKNNTDEPVYVALCMYYDGKYAKYYGSEGWWKVEPGEKAMVSSVTGLYNDIYYYAYSSISKKKYEGNMKMLVHPTDNFFINNADKEYKKVEDPVLEWRNFRYVNMNLGALQFKYTIELNY